MASAPKPRARRPRSKSHLNCRTTHASTFWGLGFDFSKPRRVPTYCMSTTGCVRSVDVFHQRLCLFVHVSSCFPKQLLSTEAHSLCRHGLFSVNVLAIIVDIRQLAKKIWSSSIPCIWLWKRIASGKVVHIARDHVQCVLCSGREMHVADQQQVLEIHSKAKN